MNHQSLPPLISPRSPSYERAWREFPQPSDARVAEIVALLARLSEAEQNAASICLHMAAALSEDELADVVHDMGTLHAARRQALGKLIERFGGSPPTDSECRMILPQASDAAELVQTSADAERVVTLLRKQLAEQYDEALRTKCLDDAQRAAVAALAPIPA